MLNEPITMHCAMKRISEISYVNSSTYAPGFTFNLIGDYSMNEILMVDHICITCDRIAELQIDLPRLDCLELARFLHDSTPMFCVPKQFLHIHATDLYITYICKLSCILHNGNNEHDNIIECNTFWSLLCSKYHSSTFEAWYPISTELHYLNWFYLAIMKFDHRSSVRTLDLILNNQNLYIDVSPCDHAYMSFTYTCNCDCYLVRCYLFSCENYVLIMCNFCCLMSCGNNYHVHNNDAPHYRYMYCAYTLFFLFLPRAAYHKPRTSCLEEREDDEDIIGVHYDYTCSSWKEILSLTDVHYKVNSFLVINNVCHDVNFILPKFMHLCMIRFIYNTSIGGVMERVEKEGKHEGYYVLDKTLDCTCSKHSSTIEFFFVAIKNSTSPLCCDLESIVTKV